MGEEVSHPSFFEWGRSKSILEWRKTSLLVFEALRGGSSIYRPSTNFFRSLRLCLSLEADKTHIAITLGSWFSLCSFISLLYSSVVLSRSFFFRWMEGRGPGKVPPQPCFISKMSLKKNHHRTDRWRLNLDEMRWREPVKVGGL